MANVPGVNTGSGTALPGAAAFVFSTASVRSPLIPAQAPRTVAGALMKTSPAVAKPLLVMFITAPFTTDQEGSVPASSIRVPSSIVATAPSCVACPSFTAEGAAAKASDCAS